ncbi:hypothetical protein D3C87_383340 [compost metagenome]
MEKRAICLFIIGEKYQAIYSKLKKQFETYSKKYNADLVLITEAPDTSFHRSLLSQKLLLPSLVLKYDLCLFMDLDILISENAPDIFLTLPKDKSFGAILDPRGTDEFNKTWAHIPRILSETTFDYFTLRNFDYSDQLQGSINGGIFIFRPQKIADLFSKYYYSNHNQGELNSFEETPMAYITQTKNLFFALDNKFNTQVLYKIKGTDYGNSVLIQQNKIPKLIRKYINRKNKNTIIQTPLYRKFIQKLLEENYFVHFAGNYPIPNL